MKLKIADRWKWIAKEKDDDVWMYTSKPVARQRTWCLEVDGTVCNAKPFDLPDLGPWSDSLHEILPDGTLRKYVERPDLPVDTKMLVRKGPEAKWIPRHFKRWDEKSDRIFTFGLGASSWTAEGESGWPEWKLPEDDQK